MHAKSVMKTLYFEPPPPSLSLIRSLSLSLNRIRARRRRSLRRVFLFRGEKNGAKTVLKTRDEGGEAIHAPKKFSLSLSVFFVFVRLSQRCIHYSFTSFFDYLIHSCAGEHANATTRHIPQLENHVRAHR